LTGNLIELGVNNQNEINNGLQIPHRRHTEFGSSERNISRLNTQTSDFFPVIGSRIFTNNQESNGLSDNLLDRSVDFLLINQSEQSIHMDQGNRFK